jgi:glycine/D-amino acid oxidase-like deaminating enzyme
MCTTGMTIGLVPAIARYGLPTASRLYLSYNRAIDFVEELVATESIDCDFDRTGKLTLARKPAHFDRLVRTHDTLASRLDYETELVPADRLGGEVGTTYYHGGLVDPLGAGLHPGKFVRGLAAAAERAGVELHERLGARRLQPLGGGDVEVVTDQGPVRAGQVLVATNGYTDAALPDLRRRIVPIGSFIIVTERLGRATCDRLLPARRMASDSAHLLYYFRITPDQRLLFGGRARFAMSNPASDRKSAGVLVAGMTRVFPELGDARIDYAWGGLVGFTLDRIPHAGEANGVYYSVGYCGHGVQMATYMGRQMAEVMDGDAAANPWGDFPFKPVPFHHGRPWFLPFVGMYYRAKDLLR